MKNIFEQGVLIALNFSIWTGRIKLPPTAIDGADPDFVSATKCLVDKDVLKPMSHVKNMIRSYVSGKSLPFPIKSILFVPKDMISEVDEQLKIAEVDFLNKVEEFAQNYDTFIEQAKEPLGELFNAQDYPHDIRSKFNMSWAFYELGNPGRGNLLSPELYEREKEKFQNTMSEFRDVAMTTLRDSFADMVQRLVDRLKNNKTFKASTVENLKAFMDDFDKLNITDDNELAAIVQKAKQVMDGNLTAQDLRDDDSLKKNIAEQMEAVQEEFFANITDRPRRKLDV